MAVSLQSWNNVLSYIKSNLGVPINMLELSDDEIVEYLQNHTLYEFSQYVPKKKYYLLDEADLVDETIQKYKINVDDPIIDVRRVYTFSTTNASQLSDITSEKVLDSVLFAKFESMVQYLSPAITWRFEQPNYLIFFNNPSIDMFLPVLIEYNTTYNDLSEIPADMYIYFKKLALADIKILIGNTRTKYQLSTPFGQIINNGEILKQEGLQERQMIIETLNMSIPPDYLVEWVF
jgi:hypothetical protein